jgi:hypothetical protein
VYAVNPHAVSRYRDRHRTTRAKSDRGDAKVLADLVRTDRHNHRQVAGDSLLVEAVKVLARAHQNLIWARQRHVNALRSARGRRRLTTHGPTDCGGGAGVESSTDTMGMAVGRESLHENT